MNHPHHPLKRIAIIYTGGTIGMESSEHGLVPSGRYLTKAIDDLALQCPQCHFETMSFEPLIDSSQIQPSHWQMIIEQLIALMERVDGIVMLHGTDTMAYTASVLHYALPNLRNRGIPLILTGAQRPWSDPRSDARTNVMDAIDAACHDTLNGVFIAFHRQLFLGVATRKIDCEGFHGFDSPNQLPIKRFDLGQSWPQNPILSPAPCITHATIDPAPTIIALWMIPNQDYTFYGSMLTNPAIKGLIIMAYGSGNLPDDPFLRQALSQVIARGGLVVVLTQCMQGSVNFDQYAAAQSLKGLGLIAGYDLTPEAAQARLRIALSQPQVSARDAWFSLT
jgi:L-asparaginase/Glu-tRNA(Gln) amidotransferase subunit D